MCSSDPGRIDDMLVIRGENVYPSAIEEVLRGFSDLGGGEFEIVVTSERHMDELTVRAEAPTNGDRAAVASRIGAELKRKTGVRAAVELCDPGSLARTDLKSRRVRDLR